MDNTNDLFGSGGDEPEIIPPAATPAAKTGKTQSKSDDDYGADAISVLEGLEPVRRRPGMYIGGTDDKAMHHLFAEVIDNSMDEAVAGHATWIEVELDADGYLHRHRQRPRHSRSIRIPNSRTSQRSKSS